MLADDVEEANLLSNIEGTRDSRAYEVGMRSSAVESRRPTAIRPCSRFKTGVQIIFDGPNDTR